MRRLVLFGDIAAIFFFLTTAAALAEGATLPSGALIALALVGTVYAFNDLWVRSGG